ncbi:alpha/beta hydrolase family protein [Gaetbulibacter aestuarii]|uniref:Alpha/beta fold hydrolase n=1 Tax=Gaetbulibacter aestuarii TaxID=1502358 RepID=A0ABW7N031_9FLAO
MILKDNYVINGRHQKPILIDTLASGNKSNLPVVIFCHGYKGFKDWGAWNLMGEAFAKAGFFFLKFNFSHNGGTVRQPIDFPDLEAFAENNYTKELDDLETVIDWLFENKNLQSKVNLENLSLIGHSRGGGIVVIKAEEDRRIKQVISLASVSDFGKRMTASGDLEQWKKSGVKYVLNGRTKQQMPHHYQFYEDFKANEERFTIERAVAYLKIPHLIIHGDADPSVSIEESEKLHQWNPDSTFMVVKGADHVFNTKHPWDKNSLSNELAEVVVTITNFINKNT